LSLLYAIVLHCLAAAVTGSAFKVRGLFILLGLVVVESIAMTIWPTSGTAGVWAATNLVGVQVGYFCGIFSRGIFEHATDWRTNVRPRRTP
jgi:hypothetical protein